MAVLPYAGTPAKVTERTPRPAQTVNLGEAAKVVSVGRGFTDAAELAAPRDLAAAMESLPAHYREIVLLRDLEGLGIQELSERLGLTREAAKARLHRAPPPGFFARLFGKKPAPVSIRLADSRERYKLPRYRAHHALTDALATAELLQAQVAHRFTPETPLRELWC